MWTSQVARTESGGSGGSPPGKNFKFKVAIPLKFNSESLSYGTENCRRLFPVRGGLKLPNSSENPNNVRKWVGGVNACSD